MLALITSRQPSMRRGRVALPLYGPQRICTDTPTGSPLFLSTNNQHLKAIEQLPIKEFMVQQEQW
jgi:hypothetical protein